MKTDEDLVADAIRDGRMRRIPEGVRAEPPRDREREAERVRPEICGAGRWRRAVPGADEQG